MEKTFRQIAQENQRKAWEIIRDTHVIDIWQSAGAEIHLVGSLRTGLLMTHRDIDFHIYSDNITTASSFAAMAALAECRRIRKIECSNLLHTDEQCIEWHAWYEDENNELWQIDMIHMPHGSAYEGYFERVAERIEAVLTDETRDTILRLKHETPQSVKIMGIEYYQAVIADGVRTYGELEEWRIKHPVTGIVSWMP